MPFALTPDRLRQSLRAVVRHKRFSALAITSLALAIALNTTMYSVLDALINPALAMHEPERIFSLGYMGDYRGRVPEQDKIDAIRQVKSFEGIGGTLRNFGDANVAERGSLAYEAQVRNITPNYFSLLGNRALHGRLLSAADLAASPRPVVISERLWKQLLPGLAVFDTAAILVGGEPRLVVGVLPHEADFPGSHTDVWQLPPPNVPWYARASFSLVRLAPGVTREQAEVELRALADRWAAVAGEKPKDVEFRLRPAVGEPFRLHGFHLALIGAVLAVLVVACVNLANLQLARGISRSRELATRSALGASRGQIIGQLVFESMILAVAGLVVGLLLTIWGMRIVTASVPPSLSEFVVRPQTSWRLFAFASAAALVCLGFIGLFPAIRLSRVDINEVLKSGAGTGTSRRMRRQYGALVVVQISLALALLVGATLLGRTAVWFYSMEVPDQFQRLLFGNVRVQPPGPAPSEQQRLSEMSGVPLGSIGRPAPPPRDPRRLSDVGNGVLTRVLGMPGVENAAVAWFRTPVGLTISLADPGGVPKQMLTGMTFSYQVVSSEYPRLMGLTIHKGRDFAPGEFAEPLVIVDDRTARFLWPGQEPIGQRIKFGRDSSRAPWLEVIGVVRAFNFYRPFSRANQEERLAPRMGAVFVLNGTDTSTVGRTAGIQLAVRVRSADSLMTMPYLVRRTVRNPGEGINLSYLETWMRLTRLDVARERQRFVAVLFTTFAALALAVAALGVYAIVSHSVSQRTREFGVRYALGAGERDIRKSVLFEGNVLALTGIALGLILAARTVGWLQAFLRSEDDRFDSPLFAVVSLLLFGVSLLASYIPARRAARINPVEALRSE